MNIKEVIKKHVIKAFDNIAEGYRHWRARPWQEVKDLALKFFRKGIILDLGCGNGRHSYFLLKIGVEVVGLDISMGMLEAYRASVSQEELRLLSLVQGDGTMIPFREDAFDGSVCIAVLHNIPLRSNRIGFLRELRKVLKKEAVALVTVWSIMQPHLFLKALTHYLLRRKPCFEFGDVLIPWRRKEKIIQRYYHLYTKKELSYDISLAGLKVALLKTLGKTFYIFPRNYLIAVLKKQL
ncbi:MAG: hypothetical protein DRJ51_01210 [Thermoprotei archaeon]|nr:MAG: hypothetical protein DRJ51_01210 [Thermoprotei archaeon]